MTSGWLGAKWGTSESLSQFRSRKLAVARRRIKALGKPIWLEVDGGVKVENIAQIARAGADTFVAGSAIFGAKDYGKAIAAMRAELSKVL